MIPTFFAGIVLLLGLTVSGSGALYALMGLSLFGAAAAVALPALGGASITPAVAFLPFLVLKALKERGRISVRVVSRPALWLIGCAVWGALSAIFLPRLLAGVTDILTIDRSGGSTGVVLYALRPVSGNITQTGYAFGAVGAFLAVRSLLRQPGRMAVFRDAVLFLACLNCIAAVVNLGEFYLGLPSILESVRTAGYAMFSAYEQAGLVRIQGTFPETSAFSAFTLPLFAFSFSLWLASVRSRYTGALAFTSLGFLLISTSGTAYTSLAAYGLCASFALVFRGYRQGKIPKLGALFAMTCLGLLVLVVVFGFQLPLAVRLQTFFESTVVNKLDSSSGQERSSWNAQAWQNFLDSWGLGVGLGSARASSFALVLLSNIGLVGTALFVGFLREVFRERPGGDPESRAVARASRQAVLASLIASSVSGTVFDLGVAFYAFAAAATVAEKAFAAGRAPIRATVEPALAGPVA